MTVERCCCPGCHKALRVPRDVIGKLSRCPWCEAPFRLEVTNGVSTITLARQEVIEAARAAAPVTMAAPFQFADSRPPVRFRRARRAAGGVPAWATFWLLFVAFLVLASWGGWRLYDSCYRQPRYQAMQRLYKDWQSVRPAPWEKGARRQESERLARQLDDVSRREFGVPAEQLPNYWP